MNAGSLSYKLLFSLSPIRPLSYEVTDGFLSCARRAPRRFNAKNQVMTGILMTKNFTFISPAYCQI